MCSEMTKLAYSKIVFQYKIIQNQKWNTIEEIINK